MKLIIILLTVAALHVSAKGYSQGITLSLKDVTLKTAFYEIRKQAPTFDFFYDDSWLKDAKKVSIEVKDASLNEVLEKCFKDQPFSFTVTNSLITVLPKNNSSGLKQNSPVPVDIRGTVMNEKGEAISEVTVTVKGTQIFTTTNERGEFNFVGIDRKVILVVSHISYETQEIQVADGVDLIIRLKLKIGALSPVLINNGYQIQRPNEITGSVVSISKDQLEKRVAPNIIDKLEGITNALVFNKDPANGSSKLTIRGESTIFANPDPLIVIDNFPIEDGPEAINRINPNDIESISILKDAAAASIWGVRAGNGVIVITTKKGSVNQRLKVELFANSTIASKPNLYDIPQIKPSDYIDFESNLYRQGYYTLLADPSFLYSPVIGILDKRQQGLISSSDSATQIDALKASDLRSDLEKLMYRKAVTQQYQVNLSGGGNRASYYFSAGFDKSNESLIGSNGNRITITNQSVFRPVSKLDIRIGVSYSESKNVIKPGGIPPNAFPYQHLVDNQGNQVAIPQKNPVFEDTISSHHFLNWQYFPLQERNYNKNTTKDNSIRLYTSLRYQIINNLVAEASYQYQRSFTETRDLATSESYFVRDKSNAFAILDMDENYTGSYFPNGGILSLATLGRVTHSGRLNLNYSRDWNHVHAVSAVAGFEASESKAEFHGSRFIGFNENTGSFAVPEDLYTYYNLYPVVLGSDNIANASGFPGLSYGGFVTRLRSFFGNAAYTYKERYTLSGSSRFDGTNYFGVKTNQKTVPLWSTGFRWNISNESFYHIKHLPELNFRVTYGYNGNLDRNTAAVTTFQYFNNAGYTGFPYAGISNIANPELRWETSAEFNIGIGFATKNSRLQGTFDYFTKHGDDLIGSTYIDPTTGVNQLTGNFAGMKTKGIDLQLNSKNIDKSFKWVTTLNFNYSKETVTRYDIEEGPLSFFSAYGFVSPQVGKPLYGLYSYRWGGLDPQTGDPRVYISDTISNDVSGSLNDKFQSSDIVFSGKYRPPFSGSLLNTFSWNGIELTINITYKGGHYFRRKSISYFALLTDWRNGHEDYAMRWQKPGDELNTDVPSFIYPDNSFGVRDDYYNQSTALIERADHIRLQFVNISYNLKEKLLSGGPISSLRFYFYANNLGIIWRANNKNIDPDYPYLLPPSKTFSLGINASF